MRTKTFVATALAATTVMALLGGGSASAKKAKGPVVLGTDAVGDWGASVDPQIAPVGDALGQDLTQASMQLVDGETLNFIIGVNSLPALGGMPEVSRYGWNFAVDGESVELDGKFTNYSRGVCDPTSGQCPPPRDPGSAPFFVRGNCAVLEGSNVTTCEEIGVVQATFDASAGTITIPVPLDLIGAKKGSKITPQASPVFGGTVEAAPSAFLTYGSFPADALTVTKTFVVPKR
jgi:hypothetical protein